MEAPYIQKLSIYFLDREGEVEADSQVGIDIEKNERWERYTIGGMERRGRLISLMIQSLGRIAKMPELSSSGSGHRTRSVSPTG